MPPNAPLAADPTSPPTGAIAASVAGRGTAGGPDRPPACPRCRRRFVILASRSGRDGTGAYARRQLWGCPIGHATVDYVNGIFGRIEILPEI